MRVSFDPSIKVVVSIPFRFLQPPKGLSSIFFRSVLYVFVREEKRGKLVSALRLHENQIKIHLEGIRSRKVLRFQFFFVLS